MAEASVELTTAAVTSETKKGKKAASAGAKKPKAKPTHPPTSEMVNNAIKILKERGGSSLPAIKKYLAANYKVDTEKLAPFIKKYLKSAVSGGTLIQTKGKGASGSFKLSKAKGGEEKKKKAVTTKKPSAKKPKAKKEKSAEAKKKSASSAKKTEKKKITKAAAKTAKKTGEVKTKTPTKQKPTKPSKAAAKSPKAPKPKKAAATKKSVRK